MAKAKKETRADLRNEDPISGEAGAHPVGAGVGAALGGAAAGAAAGAVGGPVGAVVGAAVGAVAGGYGGKAVAESVDPTVETAYWRDHYQDRDYYDSQLDYSEYEPAYRFAAENYRADRKWNECEGDLRKRWEAEHPQSKLSWDNAKRAMQDAWTRLTGQPGSQNRDCC